MMTSLSEMQVAQGRGWVSRRRRLGICRTDAEAVCRSTARAAIGDSAQCRDSYGCNETVVLASFGWLYIFTSTSSRIEEAPHGRGSLRIATTTQVLPLLSRLKPAMARTVFRVPVLM